VIVADGLADADLLVLLRHDSDPFNRWEAGPADRAAPAPRGGAQRRACRLDADFVAAMRDVLRHPALDPGVQGARPDAAERGLRRRAARRRRSAEDPRAREAMKLSLARELRADWEWAFESHQVTGGYSPDRSRRGRRALANLSLGMLCLDACAARRHGLARDAPTSASRTHRT
jgi:aminopeptidase N